MTDPSIPQWAATHRLVDGRRGLSFATPWWLIFLSQKNLTLSAMILNREDQGLSLASVVVTRTSLPNTSFTPYRVTATTITPAATLVTMGLLAAASKIELSGTMAGA